MKHICCYGGAFDPVHLGHLYFARKILQSFRPTELFFIPSYLSPFKSVQIHARAEQRLKMLELALPEVPGSSICRIEIEREGLSYTIDTLESLKQHFPEARISWVIGDDHLFRLQDWKDFPRHIEYCDFIVLPRLFEKEELKARIAEHPLHEYLHALDSDSFHISSTQIREACSKGESLSSLLPEVVESYIREQHLYRSAL